MRWLFLLSTFQLLSVCYGQKYDTSGAVTLDVSPKSSISCRGCHIGINVFWYEWFDQAYTHVAATIVKFVNNATNATITSTVQGSSFTLPLSAAYAALVVPDSVVTTTLGEVVYTLTYPTKYKGINYIERYSSTPITNANGTVKCVVSQTAMTHRFLLREYISSGLELSPYLDRRCEIMEASPPRLLVRVSSITASTTKYVDSPEARTSSAKKALPSNSLTLPIAPQTESSRLDNRPTTVLASPPPQKSANVPSLTPTFAPSKPVNSDLLGSVLPTTTFIATGNREAELAPSEPVKSDLLGPVLPTTTLIATENPEAEPAPSEPVKSELLGPVLRFSKLIATENREVRTTPSEPIGSDLLGSVLPTTTNIATRNREAGPALSEAVKSELLRLVPLASTLIATENREAIPATKIGILGSDQPRELGNSNPTSRPGESIPTVPVSQFSPTQTAPTQTVFGIIETVALSPDSFFPIGSSSIINPTDSFPISNPIFSVSNGKSVTNPTSLGLPHTVNNNPRPTISALLPSILTFTNQIFTVPNPSDFLLSGTIEIHRDGSTIITSGMRTISLGNSATVIVDGSSTTPLAVHIVGSMSQVPGTQATEKLTSALPPAVTAVGNRSEVFLGAQMKSQVPIFIILGATFLGIAAPLGLRYI